MKTKSEWKIILNQLNFKVSAKTRWSKVRWEFYKDGVTLHFYLNNSILYAYGSQSKIGHQDTFSCDNPEDLMTVMHKLELLTL